MLPETFAAYTFPQCFPVLPHGKQCFLQQNMLSPGKTRERVGNMLPETLAADICFPNVSLFCHKGNIVSSSKTCFCFTAETLIFCFRKQCFPCGKTGKHRGKMCSQQVFLATCFLVLPRLKEVAFSTEISTELKSAWTLHQLWTEFKLTGNDCVSGWLQILCGPPKEKKKKTLRGQGFKLLWCEIYL